MMEHTVSTCSSRGHSCRLSLLISKSRSVNTTITVASEIPKIQDFYKQVMCVGAYLHVCMCVCACNCVHMCYTLCMYLHT